MKNKILILAILLISITSLFAVPAVPWTVEKVQPDGTIISVYLKGDEKISWMESEDGYTLMYDSQNYVVYAQKDVQDNLTPSNIRFGIDSTPANIAKGLCYSEAQVNTMLQIWKITDEATVQRVPVVGNRKILCILAGFSDKPFKKTWEDFHNLMNQVGYSYADADGSVRDYFYENSYGLLNLQITVIGPVTVPNTSVYYADKNKYGEFAKEVVNCADQLVDYSQFATNGKVDFFHIIFAGVGDEIIDNGQQIWSHFGGINDDNDVIRDGVKLFDYSCSPELHNTNIISGGSITGIGPIVHEMGHGFGSPDYYDLCKPNKKDFIGAGMWCGMAGGAHNGGDYIPAHINPYQKWKFGWLTPVTLTAGTSIANMPPAATTPIVYKIMANSDGEHYLLENRQRINFDTELLGHGLLIWHIAANVNGGKPNCGGNYLQVYPVCANSTTAIPNNNTPSSYGFINSKHCPFPLIGGNASLEQPPLPIKREFTNTSIPQAFSWNGFSGTQTDIVFTGIGTNIINIVENADKTVSFDAVRPNDLFVRDDGNDIGNEPNNVNFFGQSPDIWLTTPDESRTRILNSELQNYSDVYVAVRVKNIGSLPSKGTEKLHLYWHNSSAGLNWKQNWINGRITEPEGYPLHALNPKGQTGDEDVFYIPWTLPEYIQELEPHFKIKLVPNWGFSILARIDDGNYVDGLNANTLLTYTFAKNSNNVAFSNGSALIFKKDFIQIMGLEFIPNKDITISVSYDQLPKGDNYTLNNFAEVYSLLSNDLIEYVDWEKCKGIKRVDENRVFLTSNKSELVFKPLENKKAYFIGAEVNFISDKMPELNDFDFDLTFTADKETEIMRFTAIRDADVYFKAQAEANKKKIVRGKEEIILKSNTIFEDATYTWYNETENVIGEDEVTLTPKFTQKYKVEIKREDDGFKSYDEVEVIVVDGVIKSLAPNPAQTYVKVTYLLSDNATNASIQISDVFGNISISTPLLTTQEEQNITLSGLISGNYVVKLIINGVVVDAQSLIIY